MRLSFVALSFAVIMACTSCDSLRRLAGRPTSADIERKRAEIISMKQQEEKMRQDSINSLKKVVEDSLARVDSVARLAKQEENLTAEELRNYQKKANILKQSQLGGTLSSELGNRYYIVIGAFSERTNAEKILLQVREKGYDGLIIAFKNGLNAVGICPTDNIDKVFESLEKVKSESFCPKDAWILKND